MPGKTSLKSKGVIDDIGELPAHLQEMASATDPEPAAKIVPPKKKIEKPDLASLLPPDLLAQAQDLIAEDTTDRPTRQTTRPIQPSGGTPPKPPSTTDEVDDLRRDDGELPDDLIQEAEQMLRDLDDGDLL